MFFAPTPKGTGVMAAGAPSAAVVNAHDVVGVAGAFAAASGAVAAGVVAVGATAAGAVAIGAAGAGAASSHAVGFTLSLRRFSSLPACARRASSPREMPSDGAVSRSLYASLRASRRVATSLRS